MRRFTLQGILRLGAWLLSTFLTFTLLTFSASHANATGSNLLVGLGLDGVGAGLNVSGSPHGAVVAASAFGEPSPEPTIETNTGTNTETTTASDADPSAEAAVEAAPDVPPATPAQVPPAYAADLRSDIDTVLASPDFKRQEKTRELTRRDWLKRWMEGDKKTKKETKAERPEWLPVVAAILKYLAIGVLVAAALWLLVRGWQWLSPRMAGGRGKPLPGAIIEAVTATPAAHEGPLPDDVATAARLAWEQGQAALALSLLYRGALRALELRHALTLPASATEGECLRLARRSGKAVVEAGFAPVVRAWQAEAYAGRAPADFPELLALYRQHFAAPDPAPRGART
ncbi:MAG: hypothetical protein Q8J78_11760 [Moraxellaceae bacterium]|nr:hypothetical protein [Moraxellaceae bacterium]